MRKLTWLAIAALLFVPAWLVGESAAPRIQSVTPLMATGGDVLSVTGENLGSANVAALYLTDGTNDVKVTIIAQTSTSITFKVPPDSKTGRLAPMILTAGDAPKLLEEPVKVTIR